MLDGGGEVTMTDADKSAVDRIAGNGVSCYTAQAGGKGGVKQDVEIMDDCGNKKGGCSLDDCNPLD